jgi:hypothetical protein
MERVPFQITQRQQRTEQQLISYRMMAPVGQIQCFLIEPALG